MKSHAFAPYLMMMLLSLPFFQCQSEKSGNQIQDQQSSMDMGNQESNQTNIKDQSNSSLTDTSLSDMGINDQYTNDFNINLLNDMNTIDQVGQCQTVCAQLIQCAQSECMPIASTDFEQQCQIKCEATPIFRRIALGLDLCTDILSFAEQQLEAQDYEKLGCQSVTHQREYESCAVFARNYSRCLSQRCMIDEINISNTLTLSYQHYCNEQANLGTLNPDQLALAINDQSSCDSGLIDQLLDERTQVNAQGMSGDLVSFCTNGPLNPYQICVDACQRLSPCIPNDSPYVSLKNESRCQELCLAHSDPTPMTWQCLSELYLNDCASVSGCY